MRPCDSRIDQLAALGKLVQRGMQFAQIVSPEPTGGFFGRRLAR